jgi:hypothetical protein
VKPTTDILAATEDYERWLASRTVVVGADLREKHERMRDGPFVFLRATFYWWIHRWQSLGREVTVAPRSLAVGDLHVENFGTWRDAEGRLVWGINDFDEACELPYTHDLVRLATSACLAGQEHQFSVSNRVMCDAILEGYRECLQRGGRPIVLAERHTWLRGLALSNLRDPVLFWEKLLKLPVARDGVPRVPLMAALPRDAHSVRICRRVAGVGSLGRPRYVGIAESAGGLVAREAKAWAPPVATRSRASAPANVASRLLPQIIRAVDPGFAVRRPWIIRRLAPDCSKIEIGDLPRKRHERKLLRAMGWETANVHGYSSARRTAIARDLSSRRDGWLLAAANEMTDDTVDDWRVWKRHGRNT